MNFDWWKKPPLFRQWTYQLPRTRREACFGQISALDRACPGYFMVLLDHYHRECLAASYQSRSGGGLVGFMVVTRTPSLRPVCWLGVGALGRSFWGSASF